MQAERVTIEADCAMSKSKSGSELRNEEKVFRMKSTAREFREDRNWREHVVLRGQTTKFRCKSRAKKLEFPYFEFRLSKKVR